MAGFAIDARQTNHSATGRPSPKIERPVLPRQHGQRTGCFPPAAVDPACHLNACFGVAATIA